MGNKLDKKKIISFLDKQGFYIVLFICVCVIGATALWTSRNNEDSTIPKQLGLGEKTENEEITDQNVQSMTEEKIKIKDLSKNEDAKSREITVGETPESDADVVKAVVTDPSIDLSTMIWPVKGEIIVGYGRETLVYSNTLGYWTVHNGIDIAAEEGSEVKTALDGVVESVTKDKKMGIVIVLNHGNEVKTVYANLSTDKMVEEGQTVAKGQAISGIGKTALFEIEDPPHLHFEVMINGKYTDPADYLN